jgi:hypothetical protein
LTEIRSERVTVWGQRDFEPGRPNRGAVHERIPVEIFMHPAMTVTTFDQVRPDGNKPIEQWIDWKGPNFSGVQFKTAEILAIWPAKRHDEPKTGRLPGITDDAEMRREAWAGKEAWSDPDVHFRRENVSALSPQLSETNALSAQYLSEPGLVGPTVSRPYISFADAAHRWAEGESGRLDPGWQDEVLQKLVTALWRGEFPPDALFHPMIPAESFSLGYVSRELLRPNESLPGRYRLTSSYQVGLPPAPQAYEYLATKSLAEYGGTFVGDYLKPLMVRLEVLRSWARRQGYRVPFLEATASANDRLAPEPPGRKLGKRLPLKSIAPTMVPRILETGGIPPGRGRLTGVTNAIREQLLAQGFTYDDSSIRKAIGDLIKKWEHDNPGK